MEKTCIECDKNFEVPNCRTDAKYCSRKCYSNGKISGKTNTKKRVDVICLQCDKNFGVQKCRENAKYCSNKCRIDAQNTNKNIQIKRETRCCPKCSTNFEVKPSVKTKFCSRQCWWNHRNAHPEIKFQTNQGDNRIEKECINCGDKYKIHKYRKNANFCSVNCHDNHRRNTIICPTCEIEFTAQKWKNKKYCSIECSGKGVLKRKSRFSQDVYRFLEKHYKSEDEKFERINDKKYFGDIWLKDYNIIVECNGDYWHCNPNIYDENYYHKKIKKLAKDIWSDDKLKLDSFTGIGYHIITIWEYDWNNDIEFFNKLKTTIENEICKNKKH